MTDTMPGLRGAPTTPAVRQALLTVLGETQARAIVVYSGMPKGLIRDGQLVLAPDAEQTIQIYGDIKPEQVQSVFKALEQALAQSRGTSFAPVRVTFLKAEVFVVGADGNRSRGDEQVLFEGVFGKRPP